jgi:hypothetical protein
MFRWYTESAAKTAVDLFTVNEKLIAVTPSRCAEVREIDALIEFGGGGGARTSISIVTSPTNEFGVIVTGAVTVSFLSTGSWRKDEGTETSKN